MAEKAQAFQLADPDEQDSDDDEPRADAEVPDLADALNDLTECIHQSFEVPRTEADDQDKIFRFLSDIDPKNSGIFKYSDFKPRIMERQMEKIRAADDTDELLDAYVAMGGDEDGGGCIDADKLISTIKEEFGMTIDIEKLIEEVDEDGSGEIEFEEFVELLSGS